jgi:hypothetical protein
MTTGRFKLPGKLPIQIIGPTVLKKAREAYLARWGRAWPESDSYLATLVLEAKEIEGLPPSSKATPKAVLETALDLMRADHEF